MSKAGLVPTKEVSFRPALFLSPEENRFADTWMKTENVESKGYAVLAPAHRHPIRAWRKEGFRAVALRLRREWGKPVYLAWGPGEEEWMKDVRGEFSSEIKLLPLTSLREMAAIFQNAAVVVTNDSGAMHTTVGVGTPTVTVYGPTRPIDWNPSLSGEACLDKALNAPEVPCLGCHLDQCPVGHICMTHMEETRVFDAALQILKESDHVKR
jgi:ADP-heptose:LPS heptosyltransferase